MDLSSTITLTQYFPRIACLVMLLRFIDYRPIKLTSKYFGFPVDFKGWEGCQIVGLPLESRDVKSKSEETGYGHMYTEIQIILRQIYPLLRNYYL